VRNVTERSLKAKLLSSDQIWHSAADLVASVRARLYRANFTLSFERLRKWRRMYLPSNHETYQQMFTTKWPN